MASVNTRILREKKQEGQRLGRHIAHDPRSWRYPAPMASEIVSVSHETQGLPLDQGNLGSCTGNALAGLLMSGEFYPRTMKVRENRPLIEDDAVHFYARATHVDHFKGIWPPDDTGSSGLAVMKVGKQEGYVNGYAHCFSLDHFLRTLVLQPTIAGFNWYSSMDLPDQNGVVGVGGTIRGGHEFVQVGLVIKDKKDIMSPSNLVECVNSWGTSFGLGGHFFIPVPDFGRLMHEQGDVKTGILVP